MDLAALLEEMKNLMGKASFQSCETGLRKPNMYQAGKRGGADFVDEAGEVYIVEREGKVDKLECAGLWFVGEGDRSFQIWSTLWADTFWIFARA